MNFFKKFLDYAKFATGDFEKLFADMEMPPCPKVVATLLQKLNEPDIDIDQIVPILESDTNLAAQILKIANSALYGLPGQVTSVSKAVALLGLKEIKNLAVGYAMTKTVKDPCRKGFQLELYWSDTIFRAVFSKKTAEFLGMEADEAFSAALLQDIALPILMDRWFHIYKDVFEVWLESDRPLHEVEDEILSWNHAQAGAWISKSWQLPDIFTCCIGLHISNLKQVEELGLQKTVVALVSLSNKFSNSFQEKKSADVALSEAKVIGIPEDAMEELVNDSKEMVSTLAEALGIRTG